MSGFGTLSAFGGVSMARSTLALMSIQAAFYLLHYRSFSLILIVRSQVFSFSLFTVFSDCASACPSIAHTSVHTLIRPA